MNCCCCCCCFFFVEQIFIVILTLIVVVIVMLNFETKINCIILTNVLKILERTSRSNTFGNNENWENQRYFDFNKVSNWHLLKNLLSDDDHHKMDCAGGKRPQVNTSLKHLNFKQECIFTIWFHECTCSTIVTFNRNEFQSISNSKLTFQTDKGI